MMFFCIMKILKNACSNKTWRALFSVHTNLESLSYVTSFLIFFESTHRLYAYPVSHSNRSGILLHRNHLFSNRFEWVEMICSCTYFRKRTPRNLTSVRQTSLDKILVKGITHSQSCCFLTQFFAIKFCLLVANQIQRHTYRFEWLMLKITRQSFRK